jgi:serine/threonine-protein phosphatase 2A regulatory subunit B''
MGALDPDLLQLPADFAPASSSPSPSPSSSSHSPGTKPGGLCKLHLEELFAQWISLPETQRLVSWCSASSTL